MGKMGMMRWRFWTGTWAVPALALAAVLLRLPYLVAAESSDEGGYLAVARQWHPGPSLYGHYWVDRPPLLIMLFQLATAFDGLSALRVVGALAAGVAVLGVAFTTRRVAGPRAAVVAAAVATASFVSPLLGTMQINGELLAAPFVAWAIALAVVTLDDSSRLAAFGTGALGVAAMLVKQNMAEPAVFALVIALIGWRTRRLNGSALRRLAAAGGAGAVATLLLVAAWTVGHGTSLAGVFDAVYPFRLRAAHFLATYPDHGQVNRSHALFFSALGSGVIVLALVYAWWVLRGRVRGPAAWSLLATLAWATLSIVVSGGFWDHYLVESIVPAALAAGFMYDARGTEPAVRHWTDRLPKLVAALVVVIALVNWTTGLRGSTSDRGRNIGTAIAGAARPGDTLVSAFGNPETVDSAGLPSPYPYMWTLPAQVEDPDLTLLTGILTGPNPPTWLVAWKRTSFPEETLRRLDLLVHARYHAVAEICGQTILVRNGVERPTPYSNKSCAKGDSVASGDLTEMRNESR